MTTTTTQIGLFPFEEIKKESIGSRLVIEKMGVVKRSGNIWKIPLDLIDERFGFNGRDEIKEQDIIDKMVSIMENGQITPGIVDIVGKIDKIDEARFVLVEGHIRTRALRRLVDEGHDPEKYGFFEAVVNTSNTTEVQRYLQMVITQDTVKFTPPEWARCFNTLHTAGGLSQIEIARKCSKTPAYVSQMLSYYKEPQEIKALVEQGIISADTIRKLQKEIPDVNERKAAIFASLNGNPPKGIMNDDDNDESHDMDNYDQSLLSGSSQSDRGEIWSQEKNGENKDDTGHEINRNHNAISGSKRDIDNASNSNGKPQTTLSLNKITGKLSKRERGEELAKKIIEKYRLPIEPTGEDDDYIELVNLVSDYI